MAPDLVEASIADLRQALETGATTSVGLVAAYLDRIGAFDRSGPVLNAVPVLDPRCFDEAAESDRRRARGEPLGPLDGIPYTAKGSYAVEGLQLAAGSPAFAGLVAQGDAFTIARLRAVGAVLIGLTTMPPMANGGMQRGLHGRAESPYNGAYLTSAFGSGSSNGSGTATAASFAAFGLGEETWSSGRAPASNNALVAYTPSRGVISVRGNWPLVPTMDVVVPHTRTVDDLFEVLEAVVADDPETRGDFWRAQPWVPLPAASRIRPAHYADLRDPAALAGTRLGVPRMYLEGDPDAREPIRTRPSVLALWQAARADLTAHGATVVEVDLPVVSNYEADGPGARTMVDRGFVPPGYGDHEIWDLSVFAWDDFLAANGDPALHRLADVDGALIFPQPTGALPDRYGDDDLDLAEYVDRAKRGVLPPDRIPDLAEGLRGLEHTRRVDFEDWLDALGLDAIVFPAVADIGPADADTNPASADLAWRNGVRVANGNLVWRHLGIPTVTVPMGTMTDTGMPVGLTIAGRAHDDSALLRLAFAVERSRRRRTAPPRTPPLVARTGVAGVGIAPADSTRLRLDATSTIEDDRVSTTVRVTGSGPVTDLLLTAAGVVVDLGHSDGEEVGVVDWIVPPRHSEWLPAHGPLLVATARTPTGAAIGAFQEVQPPGAAPLPPSAPARRRLPGSARSPDATEADVGGSV